MTMHGSRGWSRLGSALAVVGAIALGACGDDGGVTEPPLDLEQIQGLYSIATLTFDPQGSAPAADVLAELEAAGTSPTLNIGLTGEFQLFFRDPVTGNVRTLEGEVEGVGDTAELLFATRADADLFLFPLRLPLTFVETEETLSFSGRAEVSRSRLQSLFPDLYAEEQLFDPTPGILTVVFQRAD